MRSERHLTMRNVINGCQWHRLLAFLSKTNQTMSTCRLIFRSLVFLLIYSSLDYFKLVSCEKYDKQEDVSKFSLRICNTVLVTFLRTRCDRVVLLTCTH